MTKQEQAVSIPMHSTAQAESTLEGIWWPISEKGAVVAPPHPEFGGRMDNPVVSQIAEGLYKAEVSSIRFNWRGTGKSQGKMSGDLNTAEADYLSALQELDQRVQGPFLGTGYSFGAATALRLALKDSRLKALILVSPPLTMLENLPIETYPGPISIIAGGRDTYAPLNQITDFLQPLTNVRVEVIPEADHFYSTGGLQGLSERIRTMVQL